MYPLVNQIDVVERKLKGLRITNNLAQHNCENPLKKMVYNSKKVYVDNYVIFMMKAYPLIHLSYTNEPPDHTFHIWYYKKLY